MAFKRVFYYDCEARMITWVKLLLITEASLGK
jgi:hypothetical protein